MCVEKTKGVSAWRAVGRAGRTGREDPRSEGANVFGKIASEGESQNRLGTTSPLTRRDPRGTPDPKPIACGNGHGEIGDREHGEEALEGKDDGGGDRRRTALYIWPARFCGIRSILD